MISENQIDQIAGMTVVGNDGSKVGDAQQVYLDDETGRPEWVTVRTGLFGSNESFVPLSSADFTGNELRVPYDKEMVKNAPNMGADAHLSPDQEMELYRYYGLDYGAGSVDQTTGYETTTTTETRDTGDDAMTRSEERLNVGTERVQTGRARLRKHIVTENQTVNVPVTREEVRLEREPITDANVGDAMSGPDLTEDEAEVTLHEERPVVAKETVPVERVRVDKTAVTDTEAVSADVAREEIDVETDGDIADRGNIADTGNIDDTRS
jgi:uncharacterized protein (TIGR02271 family)